MGKIKRGILGGFSGKVANVIGGSWKGIGYMRSQPLSVANPNTAAQVAQRTAFSDTVAIAQILLVEVIKPLMDRFAQQMSGFNYFVQQNIAAWVSAGVFTWADLRISIGSLTGFAGTTLTADESDARVDFGWGDNSGTGTALATDIATCAYYNETQNYWVTKFETGNRNAPPAYWDDANVEAGDVIHVYAAFKSEDGTRVSTSEYFTCIATA